MLPDAERKANMVHENCGVVGIFSLDGKNVVPLAIDCLRALQHRGQESWGIAVPDKAPFRRLGLVSRSAQHFQRLTKEYASRAVIGHVRYSTFGKSTIQNAQPLKVGDLCVAHNGTIANVEELLKFSNRGLESAQFCKEKPHSHCAFEYTYFAHPSSIMEGVSVYQARRRVGQLLAEKFPIPEADVVIPVPDSARPAALGYAQSLGIPFEEGLLKDRYSKRGSMRSFIEPYQASRLAINSSITPIRTIMEGKNVVIIDDSIVRGTSSASIIETLRRSGASKISMLITYPPIRFPCYAGIDFPSQEELLAYRTAKNEQSQVGIANKISESIGADFVGFNDTSNLAKAIGLPEEELCFTCSTGDYSPLGIRPVFKTRQEMKGA